MQQISDAGLALIKTYEGFSATVYNCPAGYKTIGYGHRVIPGERFGREITDKEATGLLRHDIALAEECVHKFVFVSLGDKQFSALVSLVYNIGQTAFLRSTLRRKINKGQHAKAPDEFKRWVWAKGERLPGLIKRREAEAKMYSGNN